MIDKVPITAEGPRSSGPSSQAFEVYDLSFDEVCEITQVKINGDEIENYKPKHLHQTKPYTRKRYNTTVSATFKATDQGIV